MKRVLLLTTIGVFICVALQAQNVFNSADPIVRFNSGAALGTSTHPDPTIQGLQKWVSVATGGISTGSNAWDASSFKQYFINLGGSQMCFRLKYPKSWNNPDSANKTYSLMLFFHGAGEPGCSTNGGIYNNEKQLLNGGQLFRDYVDQNKFDGFLFYPQVNVTDGSCSSAWGVAPFSPYYNLVIGVIDSLAKYQKLDVDKIFVDGLSNGGATAWSMTETYPQRVAKVAPSSAATGATNYSDFVHVPIWFATGGLDTNPTIGFAGGTYNAVKAAGANIRWTLYPNLGHAVWTNHWTEPDFIPYMNDCYKTNPLVYFQRYQYCPDSVINARIGITAGFYAYEWQKDSVTIATSVNGVNTIIDGSSLNSFTGNEITVHSYGSYRVRFKRYSTSNWNLFSPDPAVISSLPVTQTPPIAIDGMHSKVLPAPDGFTTVPLTEPSGFAGYTWYQADNTVIGNNQKDTVGVGIYKAKVTVPFGCGSIFSPNFTVINANGAPKPDPAKNLTASPNSLTSVELDWNRNHNAGEHETGFEIYRGLKSGGPYALVNVTGQGVVKYIDTPLSSNTTYYYIVRAVGNFGAAAVSNEATVTTALDNQPPTPPANFQVLAWGSNYAFLSWTASTDNVGVTKYDIYINGVKSYTTDATVNAFTVPNLDSNTVYNFSVKARDLVGNVSSGSNQVTISTIWTINGINYQNFQGTWSNLPNFNFNTPSKTGFSSTFDLTANINGSGGQNYGFLWQGWIKIPTSANYTFTLCSDDGSALYVGTPYFDPNVLINDDGLHGSTCVTGTKFLTVGFHPLELAFFQAGGGASVTLQWQNDAGLSKQTVPNSALFRQFNLTGTLPAQPSNLVATAASFNANNLTWVNNANNQSGFEIIRSTSPVVPFTSVATVTGTSFTDSGLASNTKYYYKVRAVGSTGESPYSYNYIESEWKLNNSTSTADNNGGRALTLGSGATFTTADKKEGTHSLSFNGSSNAFASVNNSSGGQFPSDGGYNQRSVVMWIKPSSGTISNKACLFDFGNSTNGLSLRFNNTNSALEAAVVSNGTRDTIRVRNVFSNPNWLASNWNQVALVYNISSYTVYINGVATNTHTGLGFTNIAAAASNASRFGGASGTGSTETAFGDATATTDFYSGLMDDIWVINGAVNPADLTNLKNFNFIESADTTLVTPAAPANPTNLVGSLAPGNNINLHWKDNSGNETGFEIWRSVGNNVNYRVVANNPAGDTTFTDDSLFANVTYYYKVRATGIATPSGFSNEINVTTINTRPTISMIPDATMRYGSTYSLPIHAVDPDGDALTFTATNKPWFATIQPISNGNANIVFNPTISDEGAYTITVYVDDGFGGRDSTYFTMVVNDNTVPTMDSIKDITMNEGDTIRVPVHANDLEGNQYLSYSFTTMPSFASFVDSGNGHAAIVLKPGYAASGQYNMTIYVDDGYGAWISRNFNIIVKEKDPNQTVQINMMYFTGFVPHWNDVDAKQQPTWTVSNLKNIKDSVTSISLNLVSGTYGASAEGVQTGNDSGVYPDAIMKDGLKWGFFNGSNSQDTVKLHAGGLDPTKKYNFIFFSSSTCNFCGMSSTTVTTFKIGNQSVSAHDFNNSTETDTIYQVQPSASGDVNITCIGDPNFNIGGILNAMVIQAQFDDGTKPAKPLNLAAQVVLNTGIQLTWKDVAYNEASYSVYRANTRSGPYTLLNPNAHNKDSVSYLDNNVTPFTQYYYWIVGVNNHGTGIASDTISITTGNNAPHINGLNNLTVKTDASAQDDFSVSDDPGDVLTVKMPNAPSFVSLQSLGGNNYRVIANPTIDNVGWYNLPVTVTDNNGGSSTQILNIGVYDKNTRSVFVNFGDYSEIAPAPWNNFIGYGNAGSVMSNLKDETGATTPFSVQIVNGWAGISMMGQNTGNNSGAFPDSTILSSIWDNSTTARQLTISGLDNTKKYNIVIMASQDEGLDASARYTAGSAVDTLNARNNSNQTVNLNGLTPSGGSITVNMTKLSSATYIFLNAMQIEEISTSLTILNPNNLYVEPRDRTSAFVSWSDRASNENSANGYQLQRATDSMFTANVTTFNFGANTTTFTNTSLTPNTKYWYRVRALTGASTFSDWSNRAKTVTPHSVVDFNFNTSIADAPFPWNNADANPTFANTYSNLVNQNGQPSGITLTQLDIFNGENPFGVNTGNNSGIAPDNVLQATWWSDNTQKVRMKVSGLNQAKRYRLGFLGSMSTNGWFAGNYTGTYTVGNRTVQLNSWMNSTKIIYIGDIVPDQNGEVLITFSTTNLGQWAFNSGIIIEAYTDVNGGAVLDRIVTPGNGGNSGQVTRDGNGNPQQQAAQQLGAVVKMYPNPFIDEINMEFNNTSDNNNVSVDIYDVNGSLVYRRDFGRLGAGYNSLQLNTSKGLNTGVYMVTLKVNGRPVQTTNMLKVQQ